MYFNKKIFLFLIPVLLVFAGCSSKENPKVLDSSKIKIVTSIAPLGDLVKNITKGTDVDIYTVVPKNVNVHTFSLSQKDMKEIEKADLVLIYSKELEFWAKDFDKNKLLVLNEKISDFKPIYMGEHEGSINPHTWLDPILVKSQSKIIKNALIEIDKSDSSIFEANTKHFASDISKLDSYIKTSVSDKALHEELIIASHPSLVYFFQRYGLEHVLYVQTGDDIEPSITQINSIIEKAKSYKKVLVVCESNINNKMAKMIGDETHARIVTVNTMPFDYINDMHKLVDSMVKKDE